MPRLRLSISALDVNTPPIRQADDLPFAGEELFFSYLLSK